VLGPEKKAQPDPDPPALSIGKYRFLFGHNPGAHSVTLISGELCQAVGVNIFLRGRVYFGHNYDITYLHYDSVKEVLLSGTQGKCSEIRLWRKVEGKDGVGLEEFGKGRFNLPLNSLGVGFAWLAREDMLVVATRYNLHRSSQIFIFDVETGKRTHCFCKLGKIVHLMPSNPAVVLNERGLLLFEVEDASEAKVVLLWEQAEASTF
jgi:hypothetical protein